MSGPWDKYAQQQPGPTASPTAVPPVAPVGGDPVIAPPDPYKQAAEQRAQQGATLDAQRLRLAQNADARAQAEFQQKNAQVPAPGNGTLTGDEYLKTLEPGLAGQVKALSEGRRAFPTGTALKDPKVQELIAAATQYDPSLDATNAATRVSTRKDFTSGVTARNITSLNTALGHLGTLKAAAAGLENRSFPMWNTLANASESAVGDPRVKNFTLARDAVANELMKVFRGTGGSLQEIQDWQHNISSSDSPDQLNAEITKAVELLNSRLQAIGDQYQRGMGQSKDPVTLLSPHAQEVYNQLSGGPTAPPAAPPGASPGGGAPPPGGPPPVTPWDSSGGPAQGVASGATKTTFDPETAAAINALVQKGRPYSEAAAAAEAKGYPAPSPGEYAAALAWQKAHPHSPYDAANPTRTENTTAREKVAGSAVGAGLIAAGDAASGFTLDNIIGSTGGDSAQARQAIDASAAASPVASTVGTLAGGALVSLGGEAALGRAGMAAGMGRSALADTAYGAAAGAGGADGGNRLAGAGEGALAAAGGSVLGSKVGNVLARTAHGVTNGSVNALQKEGVNALTIGQTYGQSGRIGAMVKGVEDRISGFPVVGDLVKARQGEAVRQFNTKAFNKALEPIGETVAGQTGEQAIQTAQDKVSSAFKTALSGKGAQPDKVFGRDLAQSVTTATAIKRVGPELKDELASIFQPYANEPMLSGEALDDISRQLRGLKSRYAKSQDPIASSPRVANAIDSIERSVFDLFDRQASGTIPEYRAARQAYRRVSILEDAVNKARNQQDRIFTPAQLGQADRSNATKFGSKRQAAAGNSPFFGLQTAAQDVLPNKVPDSGTAGRLLTAKVLVPLSLIGAGEGSDRLTGAEGTGLTLGTILALAYTKGGQRLLTKPGRGIDHAGISRFLESQKTRQAIAAGAGATGAALTTQ